MFDYDDSCIFSIFTFHYASTLSLCPAVRVPLYNIYIPLCFYFIVTRFSVSDGSYIFTFHYASTLSEIRETREKMLKDLHSTMLLLYRSPCRTGSILHFYLHSTMLLLYLNRNGCNDPFWSEFTFHYASTLSYSAHSSNLLIKIYIPLCFYFITTKRAQASMDMHLHSTMLLLYPKGERRWRD